MNRWERAFGERLSKGDAYAHAQRLLDLYTMLLRPIPPMQPPADPPESGP